MAQRQATHAELAAAHQAELDKLRNAAPATTQSPSGKWEHEYACSQCGKPITRGLRCSDCRRESVDTQVQAIPTTTPAPHTATPWRYHLGRGANPRFHIQTEGGYQIASTTQIDGHPQAATENAEREANAAFIVKAVNHHQQLVEALRMVYTDILTQGRFDSEQYVVERRSKVRLLLANIQD